jgi:hypothetical protein
MRLTRHFWLWPGESLTYDEVDTKTGGEYKESDLDNLIVHHPRLTKAGSA